MRKEENAIKRKRFLQRLVLIGIIGAILISIFGAVLFVGNVNPNDATRLAERELKGSVLEYGERAQRTARVYRREWTNYFRQANGILVATRGRLLFVGIEPKDKLAVTDAPPSIVTATFPNDTLLQLRSKRVYGFTARGIAIRRDGVRVSFAAQDGHEAELDSLITYVNNTHEVQRREAKAERVLRAKVAALRQQPLYYEIKRGDALLNIASRFGTTPEKLKEWNHFTGDRVRIKDTLLVKPKGN